MDLRVGDTRIKAAYKGDTLITGFAVPDDGSLKSYDDTGSSGLRQLWHGSPGGIITINNKEYGKALYFYNHQEALGRQLTLSDSISDLPLFLPDLGGSCAVNVPKGACIYNLVIKREGVPVTVYFNNCTAKNFYIQKGKTESEEALMVSQSVNFVIGTLTNLQGVYNGQSLAILNGKCKLSISLRGYNTQDSLTLNSGCLIKGILLHACNYLYVNKNSKIGSIIFATDPLTVPNSYAYGLTAIYVEGEVNYIYIPDTTDYMNYGSIPAIYIQDFAKIGTLTVLGYFNFDDTFLSGSLEGRPSIDILNLQNTSLGLSQGIDLTKVDLLNGSSLNLYGPQEVAQLTVHKGSNLYISYMQDMPLYSPHINKLIRKQGGFIEGINPALSELVDLYIELFDPISLDNPAFYIPGDNFYYNSDRDLSLTDKPDVSFYCPIKSGINVSTTYDGVTGLYFGSPGTGEDPYYRAEGGGNLFAKDDVTPNEKTGFSARYGRMNPWTYSFWFYPNAETPIGDTSLFILGYQYKNNGFHRRLLLIYNDNSKTFKLQTDANDSVFSAPAGYAEPQKWHHIAVVGYDTARLFLLYVDGVFVTSLTHPSADIPNQSYISYPHIALGGANDGNSKRYAAVGCQSCFRWYNGVLSLLDIYQLSLLHKQELSLN